VPVLLGGGWYLTNHTNEKMRDNLLPVVVTQCAVQAAVDSFSNEDLSSLIDRYNDVADRYIEAKEEGDRDSYRSIEDKYVGISTVYA
jgi:hypothetical protein